MDLLDIIIIGSALAVAVRGLEAGLFRQIGSFGGFVGGLVAGAALSPLVANFVAGPTARAILTLLLLFGLATLLSGAGEMAGLALTRAAGRWKLTWLDEWGGALFGAAATFVAVWLLSSIFARVPSTALAVQIQNSRILHVLDDALPPAPAFIARVEHLVIPNGFPRVFAGLEPAAPTPVTGPNAAAVNQAAAAGAASTVKIQGIGCGGIVDGSGFVVAPGYVATNAHVVAGIAAPVVIDASGQFRATVVSFDPDLDFAVLRVRGLPDKPLPLDATDSARGTVGAVLGYPGGGPLTIEGAAVLDEQTAVGRNIYDAGLVTRHIYELQTQVRPGNSGGPLITPSGTVIGVVFAMSTTNPNLGYALTSSEVINEVQAAQTSGPVSSGPCSAD